MTEYATATGCDLHWEIIYRKEFLRVNNYCLTPIFQLYHGVKKFHFQWDDVNDDDRFVLDQHAELNFQSSNSLKQQPAGRYVPLLGKIILIPSQPVSLVMYA